MQTINDYAQAGYEGMQTGAMWSSTFWFAEQAGMECRKINLYPQEVKMSRGYSVLVNRKYLLKWNTKTLEFEGITTK